MAHSQTTDSRTTISRATPPCHLAIFFDNLKTKVPAGTTFDYRPTINGMKNKVLAMFLLSYKTTILTKQQTVPSDESFGLVAIFSGITIKLSPNKSEDEASRILADAERAKNSILANISNRYFLPLLATRLTV